MNLTKPFHIDPYWKPILAVDDNMPGLCTSSSSRDCGALLRVAGTRVEGYTSWNRWRICGSSFLYVNSCKLKKSFSKTVSE